MTTEQAFANADKSLQCLNYTVLYYNFNFGREDLTEISKILEVTNELVMNNFDLLRNEVEEVVGKSIESMTREIPFRSILSITGVANTKKYMPNMFELANKGYRAVEQCIVWVAYTMIHEKKWGKTQILQWWSNMKENSKNYQNGMTDQFVSDYFVEQIGAGIAGVR